jgi:3'-phosphoadenosine 5'-phosphosulfate sulfotransferase (PAPS reductase)/FAD synthetase
MSIIHVVSVSGGKDSAATLLLAIERFGADRVRGIFCDTGNEHEAVYAYLDYLERATGVTITRLTASFADEIARKRMFIARDQRTRRIYKRGPKFDLAGNPIWIKNKDGTVRQFPVYEIDAQGFPTAWITHYEPRQVVGSDGGTKARWTNKAKRRALAVLHPTGNPYLDLCLWKGRFPSRKAQFCTEHLKRNMAVDFQLGLIDEGNTVVSWQGVRRDESMNRRNAKKYEAVGGRLHIFRPLVEWSAMDVFDYCRSKGIDPNPLYKQGMGRVGCMPCINANKGELKEIAARFPEHISRISEWEALVGQASKRSAATFIPAPWRGTEANNKQEHARENDIYAVIEWAQTSHGGKQFSLLTALDEPTACASAYGLCE